MAPDKVDWVCKLIVETPRTHRNGFTVYRFTSVLHPKKYPEAGTKLVVWKRFGDFKKLYNSVKLLCRLHDLPPPPCLPKTSFFNRFDDKIIEERRQAGQRLLDYIGLKKTLFLSQDFVNFCNNGYNMGQSESVNWNTDELKTKVDVWNWPDSRWSPSDSWSSDDESGPASTTSASPVDSPLHNNNMAVLSNPTCSNNNVTNYDLVNAHMQHSLEVVDVAGWEDKPLAEISGVAEETEVTCHSEYPVPAMDMWVSVPSLPNSYSAMFDPGLTPGQRLAAYRVVGISDRILYAVHNSRPDVKLVLKVHRKSCWPETLLPSFGEPRPVPNMVRLIDWIETEDAVFVITAFVANGLLIDYVRKNLNTAASTPKATPVSSPKSHKLTKNTAKDISSHQKGRSSEKIDISPSDILSNVSHCLICSNSCISKDDNSQHSNESHNCSSVISQSIAQANSEIIDKTEMSSATSPSVEDRTSNLTTTRLHVCSEDILTVQANQEEDCHVTQPADKTEVSDLVQQSQRLLASVSKTLERSAAQQTLFKSVENVLEVRGRKPRSKSVLPRPRLERRFSSDDATGLRPRTANPSLERVRCRVSRAPEALVKDWAAAIVVALETLHYRGIIWRDLHIANLMWAGEDRIILTHHHRWNGVEPRLDRGAVEGMFVAPEVMGVFPVTACADWWSLGVILYQFLTGMALSDAHPHGLTSRTSLELGDDLSMEAKSILTGLIQVDVADRLGRSPFGAEEIKCHPFFNGVDWDSIYSDM